MLRAKEAWLQPSTAQAPQRGKNAQGARQWGDKLYVGVAQLQRAVAITAEACRVSLVRWRELWAEVAAATVG